MRQATVLVVDDDPDIREALAELLRQDGHEATQAACGEEALRALSDERICLVLLDLMMPEMDGHQVVEEMRRRKIDVPVILLSAGREIGRIARELELPALRKPFELEELLRQVRGVLAGDKVKEPISG